ncbi:MAG: hypothetical protein RIR11_1849 [Bacteroidota bacterium]|jgi:hypothetical protein
MKTTLFNYIEVQKIRRFEQVLFKAILRTLSLAILLFPNLLKADCPNDSVCLNACLYLHKEFVKNINREFPTSAQGTTVIYNKHGNININTWTEKKVKINITIVVNSTEQAEAEKVLNQINVNFVSTNGYIKAETMIGDVKGAYLKDFKVNYEVWMPADNQLDLSNKYGNTSLGNLNGNLIANVKFGDLRTGKLLADANLKTENCQAVIGSVQNIYGWINNGGIVLDNAKMVQMETERSTCIFRRVEDLRLTSRFDKIDVGIAGNLRLNIKFGSVNVMSTRYMFLTSCNTACKIENLDTQLDADLQFGSLELIKVSAGFDKIVLSGLNTMINVGSSGLSFCYEINGTNTNLNLRPSSPNMATSSASKTVKINNINGCFSRQGCLGDTNTRSKIVAKMKEGGLVIK